MINDNANCTLAALGAQHSGNTFEGQKWISVPKAKESFAIPYLQPDPPGQVTENTAFVLGLDI